MMANIVMEKSQYRIGAAQKGGLNFVPFANGRGPVYGLSILFP